eukprot:TRINITY_DN870_c2_g3_i1.p1 TRINITY_DN870_c2_g3~~TRINITY_DN870_c2_g3_i1.p1  ORF type:complete len:1855 (+),score=402.92 TRINITY_DN870_c2_g3_i1:53-5566(+)
MPRPQQASRRPPPTEEVHNGGESPLQCVAGGARSRKRRKVGSAAEPSKSETVTKRPMCAPSGDPERKRRRTALDETLSADRAAGPAARPPEMLKDAVADSQAAKRPARGHNQCTRTFRSVVGVDLCTSAADAVVAGMVRRVSSVLPKAMQMFPGGLRIGTACSGTEAPILGMQMVNEQRRLVGQTEIPWSQTFSCEIEPFKAAYIARCVGGDVPIFHDVTELVAKDGAAQTAFGGRQRVPSCDMFVAGTVCKDFSMLRKCRLNLEDQGKSGQTFFGAVEYLFDKKPRFAVFENTLNAPWESMKAYVTGVLPAGLACEDGEDGAKGKGKAQFRFVHRNGELSVCEVPKHVGVRIGTTLTAIHTSGTSQLQPIGPSLADLRLEDGAELTAKSVCRVLGASDDDELHFSTAENGYLAKYVALDTKQYGLPQTRKRKYMLCWQRSVGGSEVGERWQQILAALQCPCEHSLEHFLLPEDDQRVARWRSAVRGPIGRARAEEAALEWKGDWWNSTSRDKERASIFRGDRGHRQFARPATQWGTFGKRLCERPLWPEAAALLDSRQCDLVDSFTLDCAAEVPARDPAHSLYVWDVSQNVDRGTSHSSPGVCGCVTPGGWLLLPHRGRFVLGFEKLLLQGIPADRLMLGQESEVQLSDLAGNAMSLPVVTACMLAAVCAPVCSSLPAQVSASPPVPTDRRARAQSLVQSHGGAVQHGECALAPLLALAGEAEATSVLCESETSGSVEDCSVVRCVHTGASFTRKALSQGNVNVCGMQFEERALLCPRPAHTSEFELKLRAAAPLRVQLESAQLRGLAGLRFVLSAVRRGRGCWRVTYLAYDVHGVCAAELRLRVGALSEGLCDGVGVRCDVFMTGNDRDPGHAAQPDVACTLRQRQSVRPWFIHDEEQETWAMSGSNHGPSYGWEMGARAHGLVDVRWPWTICIKSPRIGSFRLQRICGDPVRWGRMLAGVPQGALWKGRCTLGDVHLCILPNRERDGADVWVLSRSPSYKDVHHILAVLPDGWCPAVLTAADSDASVRLATPQTASAHLVRVGEPAASLRPFEVGSSDCRSEVHLAAVSGLGVAAVQRVFQLSGAEAWQRDVPLSGPCSGQSARALRALAAGPLLRAAPPSNTVTVWCRRCSVCAPQAPEPRWKNGERSYDLMETNEFEVALNKERPHLWRASLSPADDGTLNVYCRPTAAAHRAVSLLPVRRHGAGTVGVRCRLYSGDAVCSRDLDEPFQLSCNGTDPESDPVPLMKEGCSLYSRQRRTLSWMLRVEGGDAEYTEVECSESALAGVGWTLFASASRQAPVLGGVLADEMGAGKTVTTIALILAQRDRDREERGRCEGLRGTLVLCPAQLVEQWCAEVRKFAGAGALRVVAVHDGAGMQRVRAADLACADVVVAASDILADARYRSAVWGTAAAEKLPSTVPHREPCVLQGVWVPAHPAEPYGGHRVKQRFREQAALFTDRYRAAVERCRRRGAHVLEGGEWQRLVLDEVHTACSDARGRGPAVASHIAARELYGVAEPDPSKRPLLARVVWGLTGTPQLAHASRVSELASVAGRVHVTGSGVHWRTMERATRRDLFLRAQDPPPSVRQQLCVRDSGQRFLRCMVRRNCAAEYKWTALREEVVNVKMTSSEMHEYVQVTEKWGFELDRCDLPQEARDELTLLCVMSSGRINALRRLVEDAGSDKVLVAVPSVAVGSILQALPGSVSLAGHNAAAQGRILSEFGSKDVTAYDFERPRVLVIAAEVEGVGANLQEGCHRVVLLQPLLSEDAHAACTAEAQVIRRVHRPGQIEDVSVTRLVLEGPAGEPTAEGAAVARNTAPALLQQCGLTLHADAQ